MRALDQNERGMLDDVGALQISDENLGRGGFMVEIDA
jgi:hypothetical protein